MKMWRLLLCVCALGVVSGAFAEPRARDLGIPFDGTTGALNAITDVPGVTVGEVTLISDPDAKHAIRTGVTAVLPRGPASMSDPVFGGWFALNGNGEMTGTTWLEESGQLDGPIMLTNTNSVGVVRDATIAWRVSHLPTDAKGDSWSLPVVAETWDGYLNDIEGFHVKPEHARQAIETAHGGPVGEGSVGGGTGMICHEFKCGTGTASRVVRIEGHAYTVGVLVQANYGRRNTLRIAGAPVGRDIQDHKIYTGVSPDQGDTGSIIVVVGTDAPLLPVQMKRLARRAALGLGRNGSYAGNGSGDIFIAFSTANGGAMQPRAVNSASWLGNELLDPVFLGTVEATEEAIINAMVAGRDMKGLDGHYVLGIPHEALRNSLKRHNLLNGS